MLLSLSKIWPTIFNFLEHENCLNEILDDLFFKKYDLNLSSEKQRPLKIQLKKSELTFVKWLINRFVNSKNEKINKFLQKIQKHVKIYSMFLLFSLYGLESRKT